MRGRNRVVADPDPRGERPRITAGRLEAIWPQASEQIVRSLMTRGADRLTAENIAQEVAVRAMSHGIGFHDLDDFLPWAYVVARNLYVNEMRLRGRTDYQLAHELLDRASGEAAISQGVARVVRDAIAHESALAGALSAAGLLVDVDEFVELVTTALSTPERAPEPADPGSQFRADELAELTSAGLDLQDRQRDPAAQTAVLHVRLLATALTVEQVAARLGVDQSRIRQRLGDRTLYGVKAGRAWRLPTWQFLHEGGVAPGIEAVLPALPTSVHPVAVWRWMTKPATDLEHDGVATSPLGWLAAGLDPSAVADIASDL